MRNDRFDILYTKKYQHWEKETEMEMEGEREGEGDEEPSEKI